MSKKQPFATPLQLEAAAKAEETRRRQDALKAAQQHALRTALERRTVAASNSSSSSAPALASEPPPPDFDVVRAALQNARHKDSKKNSGQNPRHVSVIDDVRLEDVQS